LRLSLIDNTRTDIHSIDRSSSHSVTSVQLRQQTCLSVMYAVMFLFGLTRLLQMWFAVCNLRFEMSIVLFRGSSHGLDEPGS
jgi:hypothetical protein